ncbi:TonB-dependent receptor [bacterium SCSIO 12696]|nr:TonB-dependent receptor [bacterium SCSIO 12696]
MALHKRSKLSSLFANGLTSCCSLLVMAPLSMAFAEESEDEAVVDEEIVAVGSQIKGVNIAGTLPVTQLTADDISATGAVDGEDLVRSIPQIGAVGFTETRGGTTGVNAARGDVSSINLRSIGDGNTLVLLNGRRLVLHPITQTSSIDGVPVTAVNVNALPVAGLERVEVLRDGAGALYGSDAVAGVVNYVVKKEGDQGRFNVRLGTETGTTRDDISVSGFKTFQFNDGATFLTVSGSFDSKDGVLASEYGFSSNEDIRGLLPERFQDDTSGDNRTTLDFLPRLTYDVLGNLQLRPANVVGNQISNPTPTFFGPDQCGDTGIDGNLFTFESDGQLLCLDNDIGSETLDSLEDAIRFNRNEVRTLVPDRERFNFYSYLSHELESGTELYGEFSYYYSETDRIREQPSILSNGRFRVAADYFWNPLGPVGSPNRLPGLDGIIPDEGLGFELREFRPVTLGPRQTTVESDSYRFLVGATGEWGENWSWDTALVHSEANTEDSTSNRVLTSALQAALNNTPNAFNIFSSVNPNDPTSGIDASPADPSTFQSFLTTVVRDVTTTLTLVDFKLSNASLFALQGGDAALGLGVEYRQEELDEDNSSNLDGSAPFIDPLDTSLAPGEVTNPSDVQGSSTRPDVFADRDVFSAYAELVLPILADVPGAASLDAQIAVRYEDFDDVGSITRPKFALSWSPIEQLQFRAAFSEGFRAPNLIQLNSPGTSITTGVDDFATGIALGTGDINDGPANGNYVLTTSGNQNLTPEESENLSFGIVVSPTDDLTITLDWWEVESVGTVGVLSDENESRLDAVLRAQGSFNPRVIRDASTIDPVTNPFGDIVQITRSFENLNTRTVEGVDIQVEYSFDTDIGSFKAGLNGARTLSFDQEAGGDALQIVAAGADLAVLGSAVGSQVEREFIPRWRASGSLSWNSNDDLWGARLFGSFVGKVFEPTITDNGDFFFLETQTRFNASVVRRDLFGEGSSVTFGVNNLTGEEPPVADESFGFEGELHSSRGRYFYLSATYTF